MKLASVKIQNFRGYKDSIEISFTDLTAFVGRNDVGKSTILDALDIFFNDKGAYNKMDKSDVNVYASDGDEVVISACFSELPRKVVLDASYETTLEAEYLLNQEGKFEIVKKYKNGSITPKVYIHAHHPTNPDCSDLLLKKQSELKSIIKTQGIPCDNQTVNAVMRSAIWNYYADNLQLDDIEIDTSKEDAKRTWENIASYLPVYSLFRADRKNDDGDSEVQDPLKEAVKQILTDAELQRKLSEVAEEVSKTLQDVSERTLAKLREMNPEVANTLNPNIPQ
ncbi:ATP-binding protein [uncultured Sphaerochaeta sp.]|uniref:ATP-binding protein n=1 Tax=uncultured Sphaerochaeta sp. TaxID=886478 RepID=UPI002AA8F50F|nr:ATP-binding protein [uncultured Sphaerochaeta sp.]